MFTVVGNDVFAGLRHHAVAAGFGRHVDNDGAVFHAPIMSVVMMIGAFFPGIAAVVMTTSGLRRPWPAFSFCWAFSSVVVHRRNPGTSAERGVKLGAERFDLLAGGGTQTS